MSARLSDEAFAEIARENLRADLLDGELALQLPERDARELLSALVIELYVARRDHARTSDEHNQSTVVACREHVERAVARITGEPQ